jgi:hypothetical protein
MNVIDYSRNAQATAPPASLRDKTETGFALIQLTDGRFAVVDAEDLSILAQHRWTAVCSGNTCYAKTRIGGKTIYMHRLILFGNELTNMKVDHINRNGLDNRRVNLRPVTHAQNMMNTRGRQTVRRSQYKGVSMRKHPAKPYRACIQVDGKQKHLGYFPTESEAARAYDHSAVLFFGSHARTNFPLLGDGGQRDIRKIA